MKWSDFFGTLAGPVLEWAESLGESKLEEALQVLHDKHPEDYAQVVRSLNYACEKLAPIVEKSTTKLDDGLLKHLHAAAKDSAKANNLTL